MSAECFQVDRNDNVATLLQDASEGDELTVRGEAALVTVKACTSIRAGHKIAIKPVADGQHIIKYGQPIGAATRYIAPGEWVHLQNCRSLYDAGSSSLDLDSGARKETRYG
jgi:altronate dehydratase small subunit